jgi:hypothetical protein
MTDHRAQSDANPPGDPTPTTTHPETAEASPSSTTLPSPTPAPSPTGPLLYVVAREDGTVVDVFGRGSAMADLDPAGYRVITVPPQTWPEDGSPAVDYRADPDGHPVYRKPTATRLSGGGMLSERRDVVYRWCYTEPDGHTYSYEGDVPQGDLFRLLLGAGLLTRKDAW